MVAHKTKVTARGGKVTLSNKLTARRGKKRGLIKVTHKIKVIARGIKSNSKQ